jgi:hypothetical protein
VIVDLKTITDEAITPALALLPAKMDTVAARVMLLAIGLQESRFQDRRQLIGKPPRPTGPAKSFWQGERGGGLVSGVRTHEATRDLAAQLYRARGVAADNAAIWNAIEHDDVLAAALARLLLWSEPGRLPEVGDVDGAWTLYLRTWRPGAFARGTAAQRADLRAKWDRNYGQAVAEVGGGYVGVA